MLQRYQHMKETSLFTQSKKLNIENFLSYWARFSLLATHHGYPNELATVIIMMIIMMKMIFKSMKLLLEKLAQMKLY